MTDKEKLIRRIKRTRPIFVVGSPRSGTTLLFKLIREYLKIGFGRDNGHFIRFKKLLPYYGNLDNSENIQKLLKDILSIPEFRTRFPGLEIDIDEFTRNLEERTYAEIVRRFYSEWAYVNNATGWGGKTPRYSILASDVYELFPDTKFIHIIRDGRDVGLSLLKKPWGPKDISLAAKKWKNHVISGIEFGRQLHSDSYMETRYENLLQNPEDEFKRIIDFIDYDGDREKVLQRFQSKITLTLRKNNFDKWKKLMSKSQLYTFERIAGDLLAALEYEITFPVAIEKPVPRWHSLWHNVKHLSRSLPKASYYKTIFKKARRVFSTISIKLRFHLDNLRRNNH